MGLFRVPTAWLSPNRHLVGHQRKVGRNPATAAGNAYGRLAQWPQNCPVGPPRETGLNLKTPMRTRIALIGDYDSEKIAHQAIAKCFTLARGTFRPDIKPCWLATKDGGPADERTLSTFQGIWCVPGSPYANVDGALWAITYARTRRIPFLGTCGGVQHALLEYARNVLGLKDADHAEINPGTSFPLLQRLACPLVEKSQRVVVNPRTPFREAYGADSGLEGFRCSYGLNPTFEHLLQDGLLEVAARSEEAEVRAVVLRGHPFFMGTLFQPERRAFDGSVHPIVNAFF